MTTTAPFGRWPSPLRALDAAAGKVSLSEVASDGAALYWLESRPNEGGRVVCVRAQWEGRAGAGVGAGAWQLEDISPPDVNIRSRVHEYGGGAWCLVEGLSAGAFAYVNWSDQRVWLVSGPGVAPVPLTDAPAPGEVWAHGGLRASADGRFIVGVREAHGSDGARPVRSVVAVGTQAGEGHASTTTLVEGHDFFGAPMLDPSGRRVVCAAWDHPDMQWDASAVLVTPVGEWRDPDSGAARLGPAGAGWTVAGGGPNESVGQPVWRADGTLLFISDRGGWWQPYGHSGDDDGHRPRLLSDEPGEFHGPDWPLRLTTMAERADGRVVARRSLNGMEDLVLLPTGGGGDEGAAVRLEQPCVSIAAVCAYGDGVAFIGAGWDGPTNVWVLAGSGAAGEARAVHPRDAGAMAQADVSVGQPFALTGRSGRPVHGIYYPPTRHDMVGPAGALPPLVVSVHGGPTSSATAGFDVVTQFFTTRGFACATVDYAGSTGYGRDFRCSLWGQWGVFDAEDCVDAARHLAASGRVDGARMAIRGGSSGGLTALNALMAGDGFRAAASWYGVTDLLGLAASTHDFEARYLDRLVGVLPEATEVYERRSPARRAAEIAGAVLLLQGLDDAVVPPSQAEALRDALVAAGRHCVARFFAGEGHGFRRAETLVAALEEELVFYQGALDL